MGTKTTNEVWKHNESVKRQHCSFDVICQSGADRLVLLGLTVCLCSHLSYHYIPVLLVQTRQSKAFILFSAKESWTKDNQLMMMKRLCRLCTGWF